MIDRSSHRAVDWVVRNVGDHALPSAVLGIASANGIEFLEAFGTDRGRRTDVDDAFALFSITKPISALVAMRAVERGQLSLTTPLRQALPAFGRDRTDVVQLQHLLSHTAGLVEPPLDAPGLREALLAAPKLFDAGTMVHYSNLAFDGVAALVLHATGQSLELGIAELASDVGMQSLGFDAVDAHVVHGTQAARFDHAAMRATNHPAAGLYGSARDLLMLGSKLLATELRGDATVVHPATLSAMRRFHTAGLPILRPDPAAAGQDYGLGWLMRHAAPNLIERGLYGHGGWSGAQFWVYPELDTCFVLMTNVLDAHTRGVDFDGLHNAVTTGLHRLPAAGARADALAS